MPRKARVNEPKRPPPKGSRSSERARSRRKKVLKPPPILFVVWEGNGESFRIYKGMWDVIANGHPLEDVLQYHLQTEED